jgi:MoaA/NifB/PqqE/SkfB family radical SAM enzyme
MDGGEPLCRDDFFEIAKYASEKHIRLVVGSNGTVKLVLPPLLLP